MRAKRPSMSASGLARVARSLWDGTRLVCPRCHEGAMFESYARMHRRCPSCGVDFEGSPGEYTGALMFAQGFFGVLGLMGWFVLEFLLLAPKWVGWTWLVVGGLLAPALLYRNFKGAWFGAMYAAGGFDAPGPLTRP